MMQRIRDSSEQIIIAFFVISQWFFFFFLLNVSFNKINGIVRELLYIFLTFENQAEKLYNALYITFQKGIYTWKYISSGS